MKLTLTFIALALLVTVAYGHPVQITTFEQFKAAFNKQYASAEEEAIRRANFDASLAFIEANQGKLAGGVQLAINELSDLSDAEFAALSPAVDMANSTAEFYDIIHVNPERNLPAHFDWREKIRMPAAITQSSCGACWAFAAATTIETQLAFRHNIHVELSKQELVDCTRHANGYQNNGCHGGFPWEAFRFAQTHGLVDEHSYPYKGLDNEACYDSRLGGHKRYHVNGFHRLGLNAPDEALMTVIKNHGPVSVHIMAHFDAFKHYRSGILRNIYPGTTHITHAVAIVGWGTEHGIDYWVMRNSWGPNYGEHGYVRVERHHNNIGLNNYVSFPVVN